MHKSLTTGNFQRDFLPGGFFCQEILEDRHGGDVVRFEYRLSLSARNYNKGISERVNKLYFCLGSGFFGSCNSNQRLLQNLEIT